MFYLSAGSMKTLYIMALFENFFKDDIGRKKGFSETSAVHGAKASYYVLKFSYVTQRNRWKKWRGQNEEVQFCMPN